MRRLALGVALIAGLGTQSAGPLGPAMRMALDSGPVFAAAASSWPQFRGNPLLTGVAGSPLPANLKLLWTYDAKSAIESSAAIDGNVAYVGTGDGNLLALDITTGKVIWTYGAVSKDLGIGSSSPAVSGQTVYIGDLAGIFHAVNTRTGKARWTFKTGAEIKSSPVVVGDRVLIGSYDGHLYAFATTTGKLLWKFSTNNYVHATPAIAGGVAYFGGCDEFFHAVRISDGKKVGATPEEPEFSIDAYTAASPAMAGGVAYFGTFNNEVVAVDHAAKRVRWRFSDPDRQFPFYSSAAISGPMLVIGGRDKRVRALTLATGAQRWEFPTAARIDGSPAIAGDRVVVGSGDGKLYVLDLATGRKVWEFDSGAGFTTSPAIAGGRIVIGDMDGKIYGFGG